MPVDSPEAQPTTGEQVDVAWWLGFEAGGQPTIGAVRRLRGYVSPDDPQSDAIRRLAAEVESIRLALGRGARLDELSPIVERCRRIIAGERVGVLAEAQRFGGADDLD